MKVCLISLGCPKNLIDSEVMAGRMAGERMEIVYDPSLADVAVVNTCGFIQAAVDESIETVRGLCRLKETGRLKGVIVAGCMVQRFGDRMRSLLPAADLFMGISDYAGLPEAIRLAARGRRRAAPPDRTVPASFGSARTAVTDLARVPLTPPHTAYLRIAEGCNHRCAFCTIPSIRGRLRSKPIPILLEEVRRLADLGVKELNLVAEDTADYGRDLAGGSDLAALLDALAGVAGIAWIRVLYAFPSRVTDRLIRTLRENRAVVPYLDVPIQHFDGVLLRTMRRGTSPVLLEKLVQRLRDEVPGIVLRTSVIIGYPGESDEAFERLFGFARRTRFERLGAFPFSPEEGTAAARLSARPPPSVVERRIAALMTFQRTVIEERNRALVGQELDVIVDFVSGRSARARTQGDAPEIDCEVRVTGEGLTAGSIMRVLVTGHEGYDLSAVPAGAAGRAGSRD